MDKRISVRKLVEFILRSGSIDSRFTGVNRLEEGSRIHRKLQKAGGENYQTEVRLSITEECGSITFTVEDRAAEDLSRFFTGLLEKYAVWAQFEEKRKAAASLSMRSLAFPFEGFREGQRRLAAAVYKTVQTGGHLFAMAPTGIGKTISVLFPAIKAIAEGQKIFYLTAKTVTRQSAQDALE